MEPLFPAPATCGSGHAIGAPGVDAASLSILRQFSRLIHSANAPTPRGLVARSLVPCGGHRSTPWMLSALAGVIHGRHSAAGHEYQGDQADHQEGSLHLGTPCALNPS